LREPEYLALIEGGEIPTMHPMAAGGPGVITVNEVEYAAGQRGESLTVVNARWRSGTMRELHGDFLEMITSMRDEMPATANLRFMLLFES
jgi:hypothetical protein